MKKKCGKYNSVGKNDLFVEKKKDSHAVTVFEQYIHSIDIREKRIGIVFKVIYVFSVFFATLYMMISNDTGEGLSAAYNTEVCAIAFLFCLLIKMLWYIFNELKCFRLNNEELPQQQVVKTEECYTRIFKYFLTGGITSLFMIMIIGYVSTYLTQNILKGVFMSGIILGSVLDNAQLKKYKQFRQSVSDIIWTIVIISVMVMMKLGELA